MDCNGWNRIDCPYREGWRGLLPGPCLCREASPNSLDPGWASKIIRANLEADERALTDELIRLGWTPPAAKQ